jgi:hypothetical protein
VFVRRLSTVSFVVVLVQADDDTLKNMTELIYVLIADGKHAHAPHDTSVSRFSSFGGEILQSDLRIVSRTLVSSAVSHSSSF